MKCIITETVDRQLTDHFTETRHTSYTYKHILQTFKVTSIHKNMTPPHQRIKQIHWPFCTTFLHPKDSSTHTVKVSIFVSSIFHFLTITCKQRHRTALNQILDGTKTVTLDGTYKRSLNLNTTRSTYMFNRVHICYRAGLKNNAHGTA